jgi:ATP-binding protein involved in chromosome partitioning
MTQIQPHDRQSIPGVATVLAVSSGKGGVGKSTLSTNLALALSRAGQRVGLLDTDIYGPNIPGMLGLDTKPTVDPQTNHLLPCEAFGLKALSMGLLIDPGTPVIWRGPMLAKMVNQFLFQVEWGELDILVLDLPPGTGDVQITLTQTAPLTGALIVTTPSTIALEDVRRGVRMFRQSEVPILGIIENMSHFTCDKCGETTHPFGREGGQQTANSFNLPFLGAVPLDHQLQHGADAGVPAVLASPDSPGAIALKEIAEKLPGLLAQEQTV